MQTGIRQLSRYVVPVLDLRHGFPSSQIWRTLSDLASDSGLGGVLLRGGEVDAWHDAVHRISAFGEARPPILADFEQGAASQIGNLTWLPKQFSVGATQEPKDAETMGRLVGRQAREFGVDLVLAPVADLYVRPGNPATGVRCFGATPHRVARNVGAFVRGCQQEGVGAVAKHFPGHGRTGEDSHLCMPKIMMGRDMWFSSDFLPFKGAIRAQVAGIMVGHLWVHGLDPLVTRPASLSPAVMRDLLRNELGFDGLVLTDSFEMNAIPDGGIAAVRRAVEAGADLVIGPRIPELAVPTAPTREPVREEKAEEVDPAQSDAMALSFGLDVARRGVAWIGPKTALPTDPNGRGLKVLLATDAQGDIRLVQTFLREMKARAPNCSIKRDTCGDSSDLAGQTVVIVVVSRWERHLTPKTIHVLASCVAASAAATVLVLFGAVDTAGMSTGVPPAILCGDATTYSQIAAVDVLFGDAEATGMPDLPSPAGQALPQTGGGI